MFIYRGSEGSFVSKISCICMFWKVPSPPAASLRSYEKVAELRVSGLVWWLTCPCLSLRWVFSFRCKVRPLSIAISLRKSILLSTLGFLLDSFSIILSFTPRYLGNSITWEVYSFPNFDEKNSRICWSSGKSPIPEDAKIKLDVASFSSFGHSLK